MEAIDLNSVINQLKGWGRAATHAVMDAPRELYNTAVDQVMPKVTSFAQDISRVAEEGHDNTVRANTKARVPGQYIDPAIGAVIADVVASRLKAPSLVQRVTHSMATEPMSTMDVAGSVVGPFKGVRGLVPALEKGEIGPLYHMTSAKNLKEILKEGILRASQSVQSNYSGGLLPKQAGVYLGRFPGELIERLELKGRSAPVVIKIPKLPMKNMAVDEDVLPMMPINEVRAYANLADSRGLASPYDAIPFRRSAAMSPDQQDDIYRLLEDSVGGDSLPYLISQDPLTHKYGTGTMAYKGDINLHTLPHSIQLLRTPEAITREDDALKTLMARLLDGRAPTVQELPWWLR